MKFIHKLLDIFYPNYNKLDTNTDLDTKNYQFGITFQLDQKDDINIKILLPDNENLSVDNMVDVAEKYAQLLLAINKGFLTHQILQILTNQSKITENTEEKLFIDNVIVFYDSLKQELNKIQTSSSPLIKPMSVFRIN